MNALPGSGTSADDVDDAAKNLRQDEISDALAGGGPAPGVAALGVALRWAIADLASLATSSGTDRDAAFAAAAGLDDALNDVGALAGVADQLVERGRGGDSLAQHLNNQLEQLAAVGERLVDDRNTLVELQATEADLAERAAELEALHSSITEIRRLDRLVVALSDLEPFAEQLDAHVEDLRSALGDTDANVDRLARRLEPLAQGALVALDPAVRGAIDAATTARNELADRQAELDRHRLQVQEAEAQAAELRLELHDRRFDVGAHIELDREVLAALEPVMSADADSGLAAIRSILDEVTARLDQVDDLLGDAVETMGQREAERQQRALWST